MSEEKWEEEKIKNDSALVVGAGIGGIKAALDLADSDHYVYLLDDSPYIGGTLSKLDRQFPTNDCGMCKMLPAFGEEFCSDMCLRRGFVHPAINVITNSEIMGLDGKCGDFTVTIKKRAQLVDPEKCIACGLCVDICPVEVEGEFNSKFSRRKAIYIEYPSAAPRIYTIDCENCTKCEECVKICPTKAVDLSKEDEKESLNVGAVILALGFNPYDPSEMGALHYAEFENVVTAMEFERLMSGTGPNMERTLYKASHGKKPSKIAFFQCIGSRDENHNYCSFACCMHSLKEAMMAKELDPELDVTIFYMDMRAFGKGYHRYYENAKKMGIKFVRSRVADIQSDANKNLIVNLVDEKDEPKSETFDMVVLATGQSPPKKAKELSKILGIELNKYGFVTTKSENPTLTSRDGVFVCGSFSGPKDIPDTITEAGCAAAMAGSTLEEVNLEKVDHVSEMGEIDKNAIGIFICAADSCLGNSLHIKEITEYAETLSDVAAVKQLEFLCLELDKLKEHAAEVKVGKVIISACSPYPFEEKFKKTLAEIGVDTNQIEIVNLREGCAWVHNDKIQATEKAKDLISMAHEKLRIQESLKPKGKSSVQKALVIGGGIAGITAALRIAESGYEVDLLERSSRLGGNAQDIHYTLEGLDVQEHMKALIDKVEKNDLVNALLNSEVLKVLGNAGKFIATVNTKDGETTNHYGSVIIASGAMEIEPKEYHFGEHELVITQKDLEKRLVKGDFRAKNVVMIQCVGLRDENRRYCGRVCCSQAIKNALKIKESYPECQVHILYQDIMTYGFSEEYYIEAKEKGVNFVRYDPLDKPEVTVKKEKLTVQVKDPVLSDILSFAPDLLVLSVGPSPEGNGAIKEIFQADLKLDDDGFFEEANVKFRPVDFLIEGIFFCGLAHSPRTISESIAQAEAAAQKALTILSKSHLLPKGIISEVQDRWCVGCEACVTACPYEARVIATDRKVAHVIESLCKGCGICAVVCPSGAAKLVSYKDEQILAMIDEAVS
jgi:heterodisulfide reductase subunit A